MSGEEEPVKSGKKEEETVAAADAGKKELGAERPKTDDVAKETSPPPPPAPPMPGLSQILPMVVMLGLQKFDLEKLGYTRYIEVAFVVVQVLQLVVLGVMYMKVDKIAEEGAKIEIPEVKQFGQVITPACQKTAKEYDVEKLQEQIKQAAMGSVITGGIYYKWAYILPLVLQVVMTPCQLYESPLFQIHMLGKEKKRPFPAANPFGLPAMPEPEPAPTPEVEKVTNEGKKDN
eukprot:gnl/TRDRNA2_/TRDRNA2_193296_c0_seq1.p1 gnl/TRDRNA2_/TRDRNA2_193296_c0~~gnl/TRDRNA2_/TRDRNA2_193296_c0_seq1.p1  ORF type:complete len:232 (-),score=68.36 gnl/TRDRNA2_/TRDRNA2_193296_c0_seq1:296-991(-)